MNGEYTHPFRAHVARDMRSWDGVSVWLLDRHTGEKRLMAPHEPVFEVVTDAVYTPPSLVLGDEMARALLDALAAYFGGTSEVQTLRRDYDAERKRVDRLIEALVTRS